MDGSDLYTNHHGSDFAFSQQYAASVTGPSVSWQVPGPPPPSATRQEPVTGNNSASPAIPTEIASLGGQYELSNATLQILVQHGFVSRRALSTLRKEDLPDLGISPLAQRRLMEQALSEINGETNGATRQPVGMTNPAPDHNAGLNERLRQFLAPDHNSDLNDCLRQLLTGPSVHQPATPLSSLIGERIDLNPLNYILPQAKPKYHDITDFLVWPTKSTSKSFARVVRRKSCLRADPAKCVWRT